MENNNQQWISVKDRLPICYKSGNWDGKTSDLVLVCDTKENITIASLNEGFLDGTNFSDWYNQDDFFIDKTITHWMPLPEPPKE